MIRNMNEHDDLHEQDLPEECYKVVWRNAGQLYSITSCIPDFGYGVVYAQGLRTIPKKGKLLVLDTLEHAVWCWRQTNRSDYEIWECYGENLKPLDRVLTWSKINDVHTNDFWFSYKANPKDDALHRFHKELADQLAPWGTMMSDSVTLVKRH